ncbi:MAG TPA: osmotically inducible protein OsmC [Flavobacteriales bacterium]|nr:osmotically inducible protein OsmC [Flavobacteriales bacterium]
MGYKVNTVWKEKMAFESQLGNHTVRMDTTPEMGDDSGASPKQLLLAGLAGCTGMDVVSLLNKMRVPFTNFEMDIEAELTEEHPIVFSEIRLKYVFWGDNLDKAKVEKAVKLSQDKYCGVSAMLKKNSPIEYSIEYR